MQKKEFVEYIEQTLEKQKDVIDQLMSDDELNVNAAAVIQLEEILENAKKIDSEKDDFHIVLSKKEYTDMKSKIDFLECLEAAGVDNWDGYYEALKILRSTQNIEKYSTLNIKKL